ncbi:hypothetical protein EI42_05838 [Thermosporothrix hazakensis]|uniref:Uncharacterized protein n=1 Tax=Thermosporothrix hazakensis TaxID=644383 RepID=A0A326TWP4_THEHA|nr:hypothetical protein EI42_05838 [Thermosporothrix hazakensis]
MLFGYLSYLFQQMSREPDVERFDTVFHVAMIAPFWVHGNRARYPDAPTQHKEGPFIPAFKGRGFLGRSL